MATVTYATPIISDRGGDAITINGTFAVGVPLVVTIDGLPCYGGQGRGYSPMSSDGTTIECISPPVSRGLLTLSVVDGVPPAGTIGIMVVERNWPSKIHRIKRSFPSGFDVGARGISSERRRDG